MAFLVAASYNHELHQLLPLAAPAANLQQNLASGLMRSSGRRISRACFVEGHYTSAPPWSIAAACSQSVMGRNM
jgi:hypothetical protein